MQTYRRSRGATISERADEHAQHIFAFCASGMQINQLAVDLERANKVLKDCEQELEVASTAPSAEITLLREEDTTQTELLLGMEKTLQEYQLTKSHQIAKQKVRASTTNQRVQTSSGKCLKR